MHSLWYITWLLAVAVCSSAAVDTRPSFLEDSDAAAPEYSCEQLGKVPSSQRCAFVRENCESDSLLPYTEWYYCHVAPAGIFPSFLFTLLLAALLPLYFTLLGDTAEIYFSPIMTHISQSIPKMRPRFAGVTFVAMGNGATDLSANISAIRNGDVLLSAGALTGAAMFVQCVVASEVMRESRGPVKCRGATLRDVGIYSVSILMVLAAFAHGKITYWFVVGALLLYLVYAAWVFAGDEWHERGRPEARTLWRSFRSSVEGSLSSRWRRQNDEVLPWAMVDLAEGAELGRDQDLTAPLFPGGGPSGGITSRPGSPQPPQHRHHHLISAKAYQNMVWADLNPDEPGLPLREGGSEVEAEDRRRRERRRAARRRQQQQQAQAGASGQKDRGGAAGPSASVELGQAAAGGYQPPRAKAAESRGGGNQLASLLPAAVSASSAAVSGEGGGSQLLTLSSLDGSALAAPAPVDAVPLTPSGIAANTSVQSSSATTAAANATAGGGGLLDFGDGHADGRFRGRLDVATSSGRATPVVSAGGRDAWDGSSTSGDEYGGGDGYNQSGEDEEEAGLLAAERRGRRGGVGSRGGAVDGPEYGSEEDAGSEGSLRRGGEEGDGGGGGRWRRLWRKLRSELSVGASAEWDDLPAGSLRRRWRSVTFPLLLPAYAALRLTIPFVDPATYSRRWLLATCVGAPLLLALYIAPGSLLTVLIALAVGAALTATVAYLTAGEEDALPDLDFGTSFAFGPAVFAVFGFVIGVIWIGSLASEAVGVIALLANLLRLPSSVLGLTLLAWGNSLGDFFGNKAMARRGQPTMALTACFAGPLFNMLTSMALGFASYFARRHVGSTTVELRPEVALGCVFLVLYNAAVAAAGLLNRGSLPERFYVFARVWYGVYCVSACALGLWAGRGSL